MGIKFRNPFYFDNGGKKAVNNQTNNKLVNKFNTAFFRWFANGQIGNSTDLEKIIEKAYLGNPDVYSIINFITNRSSQIEWCVYELKDRKKVKEYEAYLKAGNVERAMMIKAKAWERSEHKQLNKLITNPNNLQTWNQFIQEAIGYMLLTGNRYIYKLAPIGSQKPTQLFILPSHFMTVKLREGANYLNREDVEYIMDTDFGLSFTKDEVYHSKFWNPASHYTDFLYGLSPLQSAMGLVEKSNDSYNAAAFAYKNMGVAGILSQGNETGDDNGWIEPDEAKQIDDKFSEILGGSEKFKKIITTSASVKWTNFGMSPVDLGIIESQKLDLIKFCNIYRVPSVLMNSEAASTYDNMTQAERSFYLNAALPACTDLRDVFNNWIVPAFNEGGKQYYIDYEIKTIPSLQADLEKLSERLMRELGEGLWTRNEIRLMIGEEPMVNQPEIMDKIILPNKYLPKTPKNNTGTGAE